MRYGWGNIPIFRNPGLSMSPCLPPAADVLIDSNRNLEGNSLKKLPRVIFQGLKFLRTL